MNTKIVFSEKEKNTTDRAQKLRLSRFWMSVATYLVAMLATFLITHLGIGTLNFFQWAILIGWCLLGISLFFTLFITNTNLLFPEPSLTREQILFSSIYGIMVMYWLPEARSIIFLFILAPFSFGMLILKFKQLLLVAACILGLYAGLLIVEYFNNRQGFNIQYQLFLFFLIGLFVIWFTFFGGFISNLRHRLRNQKEEVKIEIQQRKLAQQEKEHLISELKELLENVRALEGIIPICMHCKEIRDDKGSWNQLEKYITEHSEAQFSHSICGKCRDKHYPNL